MLNFLRKQQNETPEQYLERIKIQKQQIKSGNGVTLQEQVELRALESCKINLDLLGDYLKKNYGVKPYTDLLLDFMHIDGVDINEFKLKKEEIWEQIENDFSRCELIDSTMPEYHFSLDPTTKKYNKDEKLEELYGFPFKSSKMMKPNPRRGKYSRGHK